MQLTPTCMLKALSSRQSFCSFFFSSYLASTLTLSVNAGSPTLLATNNRSLAPPRRLVRSPFICFPTCFFSSGWLTETGPQGFARRKYGTQITVLYEGQVILAFFGAGMLVAVSNLAAPPSNARGIGTATPPRLLLKAPWPSRRQVERHLPTTVRPTTCTLR